MANRPNLRVVDVTTGEAPECPSCAELQEQLAGAELDLRGKRSQIARLKRDRLQWMVDHPEREAVEAIFDHWRLACRHPNSKLDPDRFEAIEGNLRRYGRELCDRAIEGAAYDPFVTTRRNGSKQRHDGVDLIFARGADKFEQMVNRAPRRAA